jgi:hypothetical protein
MANKRMQGTRLRRAPDARRWPKESQPKESIWTRGKMWVNIAIRIHMAEVCYENHPDDP